MANPALISVNFETDSAVGVSSLNIETDPAVGIASINIEGIGVGLNISMTMFQSAVAIKSPSVIK